MPTTERPWRTWRGARSDEHEGRISEAESEVARAVELARRGDAKFELVLGLAGHTRLKGQLGDRTGAKTLLGEARQALSECVDPGILPHLVATVERDLRLAPRQPTQAIYAEDLSERELAVRYGCCRPTSLSARSAATCTSPSTRSRRTTRASSRSSASPPGTRRFVVRQELGLL